LQYIEYTKKIKLQKKSQIFMQEVKGFWTKKRRNTTTTKQKSKHKNPSQSLDLNPVSMPLLITSNNPMQRSMLNHL